MSAFPEVPPTRLAEIDALVDFYVANQGPYRRLVIALNGQISDAIDPENHHELASLVHSVKYRLKSPEHLRDKLIRKHFLCEKEGRAFPYTTANLFSEVGDLAGYRIRIAPAKPMVDGAERAGLGYFAELAA